MNDTNDNEDIQKLFDDMAKKLGMENDDGVKAMFSMLVRGALRYRDHMMASKGVPLTIGETREALDAFMSVMKSHEIPEGLGETVKGLVMTWLEDLKNMRHN